MKKTFPLLLLLALAMTSASQSTTGQQETQTDFLKKSKILGATGIVLVSGGTALFLTGMVVYPKDYDWLFGTTPEKDRQANTAGVLMVSGLVCVAASIPFFIVSAANKRKARNTSSLGFKMEKAMVLNQQSFSQCSYPALSLKIHL
ncbi:MAG: hypothetical protein ABIT05_12440 [Chitinophagaceae bacterium]